MSTAAIIMMVIGLGVTWGGATFCMRLAMKKQD
ncbi:MetS family NSS transporter small subunit [Pseudodesulfovibrio sp. zrk46]|nr:MetS family NSS transporter small subunit [Pseudodesulfovibrio sp. zrk46]QJB55374.1 MetS family NSS transporter small subunit [Pseudodesulfovibrio sp. zrk46]